jgi:signal transduction histidine kinase
LATEESGGPALEGIERRALTMAVAIRVSSALVGGLAALIGLSPPAERVWVLVAVSALFAWSVLFAVRASRGGLLPWMVLTDLAVATVLCLVHQRLVPDAVQAASAGTGWVDLVVSTAVFLAQFLMAQPHGLLAALWLAVVYAVGTAEIGEATAVIVAQGILAAALMTLLRRAARNADGLLAAEGKEWARTRARAAARTDQLDQQRALHDTVLATLTMVGTGDIGRESPALRGRIAADLEVLGRLVASPGAERTDAEGPARLDLALRSVARTRRPVLRETRVDVEVVPLQLPREVVVAISASVAEALSNVARHARARRAVVTAGSERGRVIVEVADDGRGFERGAVPPHRRGLRESIVGRMASVGGDAEVLSHPGEGTRVLLRWQP